jgi:hypothetical protein
MSKRKRYFDITLSVMRPVPHPDILISISYLVIGAEESGQIRASGRDVLTRTQLERDGVGQRACVYTDEHEQPGDGAEESGEIRAGGRDASTVLKQSETVLGKEHPGTLTCMYCLVYVLSNRKRFSVADALYQRALNSYERA